MTPINIKKYLLAGDIGGTNTRLLLAEIYDNSERIVAEKSYLSADFSGLIPVIKHFLSDYNITVTIDRACLSVAGPVVSGVVSVTNITWVISEQQLIDVLKTKRVKLINDFVAAAMGVSTLQESDVITLQKPALHSAENSNSRNNELLNKDAVILGAGTGMGVAHLIWLNDQYRVFPSEAGHIGFAPENSQQNKLLAWMQTKHARVSLEMLLSGRGLLNIYNFLHEVANIPESINMNEAMNKNDPAQLITDNALLEKDNLCQKTLELFIDIYGSAASNAALFYYPVGKLYIAGGIAPKIKELMMGRRFTDAFLNKGLMTSNMKKIRVELIVQDKVGLYGALLYARDYLK